VGLVILLLGASGIFVQLQSSLNVIWKTEAPPKVENFIMHFLRHRFLSFSAVLTTGLLLLASLFASIALAAIQQWMPTGSVLADVRLWHLLTMAVSFVLVTLLFAAIFKLLPDAPVSWREAMVGAVVTAVLFTAGQQALSFYLGYSAVASAYGAAGSLVVILVWVYYTAQIVLFGAEFTHAYGHQVDSDAEPTKRPMTTSAARH